MTDQQFELLLQFATDWATGQEQAILNQGVPLNPVFQEIAKRMGISQPELIRVARVNAIPTPSHPVLRQAMKDYGFLNSSTIGLALGHGIYLRQDAAQRDEHRLIVHETAHVAQYERLGGIEGFLRVYLRQILELGYHQSPFEVEARAMEGKFEKPSQ